MAVMYTTGEYVSPSWLEDSVVWTNTTGRKSHGLQLRRIFTAMILAVLINLNKQRHRFIIFTKIHLVV